MITATDLKNGTAFLHENKPYKVVKYAHQKIGRGGATVKVSARNLKSGNLEDMTFNGMVKFDEIHTQKKPLQYLYQDGDTASFMDATTYDQIELALDVLGDQIKFIKEGETVDVLFWEGEALSVDLPPKVTLKVIEAAPGVKGNSASNMLKTAKLENNLTIKVPLFIKTGDSVRVDTRTGEYVERS